MNTETAKYSRSPVVAVTQSVLAAISDQLFCAAKALQHRRRKQQLSMQLAYVDARTLRDAGISEAQRFIGVNNPS
jgi:hypothetical protein